jgi:hypothetical protein
LFVPTRNALSCWYARFGDAAADLAERRGLARWYRRKKTTISATDMLIAHRPGRWAVILAGQRVTPLVHANRFARRLGLTHQPARCMPYETVERLFLPVFLSALPPRKQSEFRRMLQLARYMNAERPLPPAAATCAPLGLGPLPEPRPLLELNLRWWARSFAPVIRAG